MECPLMDELDDTKSAQETAGPEAARTPMTEVNRSEERPVNNSEKE